MMLVDTECFGRPPEVAMTGALEGDPIARRAGSVGDEQGMITQRRTWSAGSQSVLLPVIDDRDGPWQDDNWNVEQGLGNRQEPREASTHNSTIASGVMHSERTKAMIVQAATEKQRKRRLAGTELGKILWGPTV